MENNTEAIDGEQPVLDALNEGAADFLEPFGQALSDRSAGQNSLIVDLRDAFERVVKGGRESS